MGSSLFKKKRGKYDEIREQRKKRRGDIARDNALAKRQKLENGTAEIADADETADNAVEGGEGELIFEDTTGAPPADDEVVFYGLLDPEEQTYYSNVNTKIASNDFETEQDRHDFIEAVYRESQGKELKLASSQSCSRYLEKIIMLSTLEQLQVFGAKLLGHLTHLVQHRFGSHVCETLFLEGAKYVSNGKDVEKALSETAPSMETLLLQAAQELQPNVGYMLTDRFASHTVRALLLVLSGDPLDDTSAKTLLASKRKEKLDAPVKVDTEIGRSRSVPKSFKDAMSGLINTAVSSLDATYLRALATHPTGNPVLQLLLKLELANSDKGRQLKENSLYYKLISPDSIEEGGEGTKFVLGLTYDSTGSHLTEVLVVDSPAKIFKKLYKNVWKDKMASMAKNDIASYVCIRILERLGKEDLAEVRELILPELSTMLNRRRTGVIKCLIERSIVRELDMKPMARAIMETCKTEIGTLVPRLLGFGAESELRGKADETPEALLPVRGDTHGSLLAQSMTQVPELSSLIEESLLTMDVEMLLKISQDAAASRVIQSALTSPTASVGFRKQMIPSFSNHLVGLAKDPVGSYLVDALWKATNGLYFMKEKLAGELAAHETELRDSRSGRNVWRNWSMDAYHRRPAEWRSLARGTHGDQNQTTASDQKARTPFQMAQERHLEAKHKKGHQTPQPRTVSKNV